jgi:DNA-binding transcriptional ArsR family regulator
VPPELDLTTRAVTAAAPVFAALGDPTRLRLLTALSGGEPLSIARLTAGGTVTRQSVTKHLHVLANVGIARSTQLGRERVWELEAESLLGARQWLNQISQQWDEALLRLGELVEEPQTSGE